MSESRLYTPEFFAANVEATERSAAVCLTEIFRLIGKPQSVADFGSGVGYWLGAAQALGVTDVRGYDGDYVPMDQLRIPAGRFTAVDLTKPVDTGRRFDLALCLEVGEHLPSGAAGTLVETLIRAAPVVAFSAAIPWQGGVFHVNEQWPRYWADLFEERGYVTADVIRRRLWTDDRVRTDYRQNIMLFVEHEVLRRMPELATEVERQGPHALPLVHPNMYVWRSRKLMQPKTFVQALREVASVCKRTLLRRKTGY